MSALSWFNLEHIWLPYTQMHTAPAPLPVVGASGVHLHLPYGRRLIDGIASWWTACHGYGHPHIAQAVKTQVDKLPHVMFGGLVHEPALTLAARLAKLLPGSLNHSFFSESGSVAVEVALKMAIQYWGNRGQPEKRRLLHFERGYHGDTFATMAVTDPAIGFHDAFQLTRQPNPQANLMAPLPVTTAQQSDFDALLARHAHELAAVIIEPLVQGAGGMRMHDAATLAFVRAACSRHGVLLIADEIMTGFGRTGTLFACEQADVVPDIICLSKALTGGTLPLAATVATDEVFAAFCSERAGDAFMHGPTFMANPLACAAALASLDLFEREPRLQQVAAIGAQMRDELAPCRDLAGVVDVRVKGAIGVVQLDRPVPGAALGRRFVDLGVWVRPFGDMVYLMPPFVIESKDLSALTRAVRTVVGEWSQAPEHHD
ncbi:MAG: adenosylmethionine--8-amino-7-oxononanoate transaminase [Rhodocyclaceae bacterium]|nr:adenosylmethionine--8-amino-7-oxononanoate transaminase [Rhodocyclaceae bacterium]